MNLLKSTGVTRKIDELGRIVIPKEIRKNLGIRDGEYLEIFTNEDSIILKKYFEVKKIEDTVLNLCELINNIFNIDIIITDREKVIATSYNEDLKNKKINELCINLIDNREQYISENIDILSFEGIQINGYYTIMPLINSSDSIGLIILVSKEYQEYRSLAKLLVSIILEKINNK